MSTEYQAAFGRRLREVRNSQGLSLADVEAKSGGRWKAVVVGSYERGSRSVTVAKAAELAGFYGVTIVSLLPGEDLADGARVARLTEALTDAGAAGDFARDLARRLDKAGVAAPRRKRAS
jgi:transcriptional regulator with XRE-family HTH domain